MYSEWWWLSGLPTHLSDLILREIDYIVTLFHLGISCTVFVLICTVVVLNCSVMCVCVCVCPDNVYTLNLFGYPN
jgi:hypothetical protein